MIYILFFVTFFFVAGRRWRTGGSTIQWVKKTDKFWVYNFLFFTGQERSFVFFCLFSRISGEKKKNQDFQDFCLFFSGSLEIFEIFEKS